MSFDFFDIIHLELDWKAVAAVAAAFVVVHIL